jgi:hypothetical protein
MDSLPDWLQEWIPTFRTCGVLLVWTFVVAAAAMGIEALLRRSPERRS